jgi:protein-disulfide isomerase
MQRNILAVAAATLLVAAVCPVFGKDKSADIDKVVADHLLANARRGEIEIVVKDYIASHPDVMARLFKDFLEKNPAEFDTAIEAYIKRHAPGAADPVAEKIDGAAAIKSNATALFGSARQVILGNPDGDVTMVEFFDYNCGYCKRALSDMMEVLREDPKLKVVLKDMPILGPGSAEAAQVAVAARMQDSASKYLAFHFKLLSGRGQANKDTALTAAREAGYDMDRLQKDISSDEVGKSIDENIKLARALGIRGTPGYVIGETLIPGAVGAAGLREKIQSARSQL